MTTGAFFTRHRSLLRGILTGHRISQRIAADETDRGQRLSVRQSLMSPEGEAFSYSISCTVTVSALISPSSDSYFSPSIQTSWGSIIAWI